MSAQNLRRDIARDPANPLTLKAYAFLEHEGGHSAEKQYGRVLSASKIEPDSAINFANLRLARGASVPMGQLRAAIVMHPDFVPALGTYGLALAVYDQATSLAFMCRAIAVAPDDPASALNLAQRFERDGRHVAAIRLLAPLTKTAHPQALAMTGRLWLRFGELRKSLACLRASAATVPSLMESKAALAETLAAFGDTGSAEANLSRAIHLGCGIEAELITRISIEAASQNPNRVVRETRRLIAVSPNSGVAWSNIGKILHGLGEVRLALRAIDRAIGLTGGVAAIESNRLLALQCLGNTTERDLEVSLERYRSRYCRKLDWSSRSRVDKIRQAKQKLRIGYVSSDFGRHPVGYFFRPIIVNHDRNKIEIYCYSGRLVEDDHTAIFRRSSDVFRLIAGLDDNELVRQICADQVDILVDLSGHTSENRLPVFAHRAAPAQVSWLGYFDTTGVPEVDAFITDKWEVPFGEEWRFTEEVVRLPSGRLCYGPPERTPDVKPPPSLTSGVVTFGSFNHLAKLDEPVIVLWSQLLRNLPSSRLLLKWAGLNHRETQDTFARRFARYGIHRDRLIFRGASSHLQMLEEYSDVDIALDPFPYTGGLTTCEALWMGVPVITLAGRRPVARQGVSLLSRAGLGGLIGRDTQHFISTAIALATTPQRLFSMRAGQRKAVAASLLMDGNSAARSIEEAYRNLWNIGKKSGDRALQRQKRLDI